MRLHDLPTPCAVVDADRVERNCAAMADRATALGVRLRPHVKTHKTVEAARLQVRGHFGGITVSTAAEARFCAAAGFTDITWAVPLPPPKVALLREIDADVAVLVDHVDSVDALEAEVRRTGRPVPVLLKVDCGYGRAGVDPRSDAALALARRLDDSALDFRGVLAHGGHSYDCVGRDAIAEVAREERDVTVAFAERLRAASIEVREVSIGSTPTLAVADDLTGITEVRPGNYVYFDAFQAAIGSCTLDDCAFSVLVTVIAAHPERGVVLTDGGAVAFTKDPGPTHVPGRRSAFGPVSDLTGRRLDVDLAGLSQEHGKLKPLVGAADLRALRMGDRLRVIPNHSCLTAACHDVHHVVRGDAVIETRRPCRGWV